MGDEIKNLNEEVMSMDPDGVSTPELDEASLGEVSGGICGSFTCGTYSEN